MRAPKEDISTSTRRPLMSRARYAGRPDCPLCAVRPGCLVWVMVLMYVTVGAKWGADKAFGIVDTAG